MNNENKYIQAVKTYIKNLELENQQLKIELKMVILVNKELRSLKFVNQGFIGLCFAVNGLFRSAYIVWANIVGGYGRTISHIAKMTSKK